MNGARIISKHRIIAQGRRNDIDLHLTIHLPKEGAKYEQCIVLASVRGVCQICDLCYFALFEKQVVGTIPCVDMFPSTLANII